MTPRTLTADSPEIESVHTTLADEHEDLLRGVERRAAAVDALVAARTWPHGEIGTLTRFLRTTLLRQVADEEHLLYPHDATAAPFAELGAAHARLVELTQLLEDVRERRRPLAQLRELVDELLTTMRRHLAEEEAVLAALAAADLDVPAAATLSERHQHWAADLDDGPLVISLDDLPAALARRLCIERVLRLEPGRQAVVHSRDGAQLREVSDWLHAFDAVRFGLAIASDPRHGTRLEVSCRD